MKTSKVTDLILEVTAVFGGGERGMCSSFLKKENPKAVEKVFSERFSSSSLGQTNRTKKRQASS